MTNKVNSLYIIATPIGNLEDITLRALRVLGEVDLILCEDTRVTKKLLAKYDIDTSTMSYHANSAVSKTEKVIALLQEGKNIALVSDAGTPTISDPGSFLVKEVREKLVDTVAVVAIPGASAVVSALSVSGLPASEFLFLGFLPHKKGRETLFKKIEESKRTVVFYESPHRILKTLESLKIHLGVGHLSERKVVVARELTKIHEEIVSGTADEVLVYFQNNNEKVRGEFVVMVSQLRT